MAKHEIEFRLSGTRVPDGQIGLSELSAVSVSLQELAMRIGRHSAGQSGTGRTMAAAEAVTRLRLTGLGEGSTRLVVAYGQPDVLPVDLDLEDETETAFLEVVEAIGSGRRPSWTPDLVADSAIAVMAAFGRTADSVVVTTPAGKTFTIEPSKADREVWRTASTPTDEVARVSGRLEAVDLKSGRFRIRDDVGNAIPLDHVLDAPRVAHLIDQRVTATGESMRGSRGELRGLTSPTIAATPLPSEWEPGRRVDWSAELAKPGPDAEGGPELTDEEFDEFLSFVDG